MAQARVGENAPQPQPPQPDEPTRHLKRAFGTNADALRADVDLEKNVETPARSVKGVPQCPSPLQAVRAHGQPKPIPEGKEPPPLVEPDDRVGEQDVVEARSRANPGLAGLCQAE